MSAKSKLTKADRAYNRLALMIRPDNVPFYARIGVNPYGTKLQRFGMLPALNRGEIGVEVVCRMTKDLKEKSK